MKYDDAFYTPAAVVNADTLTMKKIEAEYIKLSKKANKRLSTFEKHGETEYETYLENVGKYKPLNEIKSASELGQLLSEAHRMLTAKRSSYTAIKRIEKESFNTLKQNFPGLISEKTDKRELWAFLNAAKKAHPVRTYDSEQALHIYKYLVDTGKRTKYEDIGTELFNSLYSEDSQKMTPEEVRRMDALFDKKK